MLKGIFRGVGLAFVAICVPIGLMAVGQESASKDSVKQPKPKAAYRLDYVVRELAEGKRINSRNYTMMAEEDESSRVRAGNSVPIGAYTNEGRTGTEYRDVGIIIECRPRERENYVLLITSIQISSVVPSGEVGLSPSIPNPVFRRASADLSAAVTPGKPTIIGTMDDVVTNHRFEIEVTATKVK